MPDGLSSGDPKRHSEHAPGVASTVSDPKDGDRGSAEGVYGPEGCSGRERTTDRGEPKVTPKLLRLLWQHALGEGLSTLIK